MSLKPGELIGFMGGGQLGRMTALAARSMGFRVAVADPDSGCPLAPLADAAIFTPMADQEALRRFARGCAVVTCEREDIPVSTLAAVEEGVAVHPSPAILGMVQDRLVQKAWLSRHGFPVAPFRSIGSAEELEAALEAGAMGFLKTRRGGFDGRGQVRVQDPATLKEAWGLLGNLPCVLEAPVPFVREVSVLVARAKDGSVKVHPPAENHHVDGVLDWSVLPAPGAEALEAVVHPLALRLAESLDLVGVLVAELFVLADGTCVVNELAPRPHNSYHASERACQTSQFEQLVRVLAGLPLGDPGLVQPVAIANLLGDLWTDGHPDLSAALQVPGVRLHLYGKSAPLPGRKMGHLSAAGRTPEEAVARVLEARTALKGLQAAHAS